MNDRLDDAEDRMDEATTWAAEVQRVPAITAAALSLVFIIPMKLLIGVREKLFHRLAIKSLENYHKVSGGDAIGINARPGQQITLEPVLYRAPEDVEEGERPGWKAKGRDKVWDPAAEGNSVNYLGRTPTVQLEDDDHVEAGWLAPRIGEAIELDNYWPLFTNADINAVVDYQGGGAGSAMADGGGSVELELESPGQFAQDNIIDLNSRDGYDGMRISAEKAREWQAEHTDSERMQMQEDRGFLRGLANGNDGPSMVKLLLICAGIILGALAIILLGPSLVGGSLPSAGGGGINPLSVLAGSLVG